MKRLFPTIFALSLAFLCARAGAAPSPEEALALSARFVRGAGNISLEFAMEQKYATGATASQKGSLLLGDTTKFRLTLPGTVMATDGKVYWEYREATKQALLRNHADMPSNFQPAKMLFQYLECEPVSLEEVREGGRALLKLSLNPTRRMGTLKSIAVWLDAKSGAPARIRTVDDSGNETTYGIRSLKAGAKVRDSDFAYAKKEGTEEVDLR
ncbi:MAG: outer membrane lipoprotein carrier protein LolA [Fibrobacterales bacterium]|nr:outer membrane lipoprotein carrier protein LolA [Fibrobacterales bacterium]